MATAASTGLTAGCARPTVRFVLAVDDRTITIFAKIPRDAAVPVRLDETNLVRQGDEIRGRVKLLTFLFRHAARSVITNVPNADGSWG